MKTQGSANENTRATIIRGLKRNRKIIILKGLLEDAQDKENNNNMICGMSSKNT